jgi:hypothetical protein
MIYDENNAVVAGGHSYGCSMTNEGVRTIFAGERLVDGYQKHAQKAGTAREAAEVGGIV